MSRETKQLGWNNVWRAAGLLTENALNNVACKCAFHFKVSFRFCIMQLNKKWLQNFDANISFVVLRLTIRVVY